MGIARKQHNMNDESFTFKWFKVIERENPERRV